MIDEAREREYNQKCKQADLFAKALHALVGSYSERDIIEIMKKVLAILLALCLSAATLTGCGKNGKTQQGGDGGAVDTVIKVGVFEPLTGADSLKGKQEALGMEFANTLVNTLDINGQAYTIELKISDNASSVAAASSSAYELIGEGCDVVLGSYGSDVSSAGAGVFAKASIGMITASNIDSQVIEDNSNVYCIHYQDQFEGTILAAYASKSLAASSAYILMKNGDDLSETLGKSFKEAFQASGGTVLEGHYQEGNTDFSDYFAAAVEGGANVFFVPVPVADAGLLLSQMTSQGIVIPVLSGSLWNDNEILKATSGTSLSVSIPIDFAEDVSTEPGAGFVTAFKEWLNANPDKLADNGSTDIVATASAYGYDAYMTAIEAIKKAGSAEPADILAALNGTTYNGVTGSITLDLTGNSSSDGASILRADTTGADWNYITYQKAR